MMSLLSRLASLWRNLFHQDRAEQQLTDEVEAYLEMLIDMKRQQGLNAVEARRAALIEMGGKEQVKERVREVRMGRHVERLWQDLCYGLRMLVKSPGFTVVALVTLALGIGANAAIFSVVNGVLLRPLPYPEPDRIVMISEDPGNIPTNFVNPRNYADWREQNQVFDQVAAIYTQNVNLSGPGEPERVVNANVASGFFSILRVKATVGRTFLPREDQPGSERVAILSYELWQRRFSSDQNVIGRTLVLDDENYAVIGVMPPGFSFPAGANLWTTLVFTPEQLADNNRGSHFLSVVGRLKPGGTLEQAQSDMETIYNRLRQEHPEALANWKVHVFSLDQVLLGGVRSTLFILLGAVSFVLLIACGNVANLMLARATTRQRELAIRAALGASRGRLIRQLLTESALLAVVGGGLGVLVGFLGIALLVRLDPGNIPRLDEISIDRNVLVFTSVLSLFSAATFGLAPALLSSKANPNKSLKDTAGRGSAGPAQSYLRQIFIVAEVALSLVLLVGAGLMVKSLVRLSQVELGFTPEDVLTMRVALPQSRYAERPQQISFYRQVVERVKALPGIQSAAFVSDPPVSGSVGLWQNGFEIEGQPALPPGQRHFAYLRWTTPDYFKTLGIPLLKGRLPAEGDIEDRPWIMVIDKAMADRYFPNEDPLGKHIVVYWNERRPREIVGVVGNVKQTALDYDAGPHMYVPYYQTPLSYATLLVKTPSGSSGVADEIKNQVLAVDREQPVYAVTTMEQIIAGSIAGRRFNLTLLSIFAGVALMLAAVGIYGVISYSISHRTQEIGIRMALGAQPGDVLKLVVGRGMLLVGIGIVVGCAAAFSLTRVMSSLLFDVSATDPGIFASIALLLAAVALMASYLPAREATKIDPLVALRYE
jgi:putative ABC transport system permease protein